MKIVLLSLLAVLNCGGKSYYQICRSDCTKRTAICLVGFLPQQSSTAAQDTSKVALAAFICDDYYNVCLRSCSRSSSSSSSTR